MKVIVAGSRDQYLPNPFIVSLHIHARLKELPRGTIVVHGASPGGGVDHMADQAARSLGLTVIAVPITRADRYKAAGTRRAPLLRTIRMFDEHPDTDRVLVWWFSNSPGSSFTIAEAHRRGIPVEVHAG